MRADLRRVLTLLFAVTTVVSLRAEYTVTGVPAAEFGKKMLQVVIVPGFRRLEFPAGQPFTIESEEPITALILTAPGFEARKLDLSATAGEAERDLGVVSLVRKEEVLELDSLVVAGNRDVVVTAPPMQHPPRELVAQAGAKGSIARALQSLPGFSSPDQGNGLFIRGGNLNETLVLVNGSSLASPNRELTPLGNFTSVINGQAVDTVDVQISSIAARHGDVLSGVVELDTARMRKQVSGDVGISMAGYSAHLDVPAQPVMVSLYRSRSNMRLLERWYGRGQPYATYPWTEENSASIVAAGGSARVSAFLLSRDSALGVAYHTAFGDGFYDEAQHRRFGSLQGAWKPVPGHELTLRGGVDVARKSVSFGPATGDSRTRRAEAHLADTISLGAHGTLEAGFDFARNSFSGSTLFEGVAAGPAATRTQRRTGGYLDYSAKLPGGWSVRAGLRDDRVDLTHQDTLAPRVSLGRTVGRWSGYVSAGRFFQSPDPEIALQLPNPAVATSARMDALSAGIVFTDGRRRLAFEAYVKRYADLLDYAADRRGAEGNIGQHVQGFDLSFRQKLWTGAEIIAAFGTVHSTRSSARDGGYAATTDLPFNGNVRVVQTFFRDVFHVEAAGRLASGAPFTAWTGIDPTTGVPAYRERNGDRYPTRGDLCVSAYGVFRLAPRCFLIPSVALNNLTNRPEASRVLYDSQWGVSGFSANNLRRNLFLGLILSYE